MKNLIVVFCLFAAFASAQNRIVTRGKFTSSSAVVQEDDHVWYIGVEALLPPPNPDGSTVTVADMNFQLPPNGTITRFQGTFGMMAPFGNTAYTSCVQPDAALGLLIVDGKKLPIVIHFDSGGHRDRDLFFSFDIPLKYTNGNATVHVEANPLGCWSDVELQAKVYVN